MTGPSTLAGRSLNGVISGIFVILASEIGDKTFIVTAIMAMKHSRKTVFFGALTAASLMISLSAAIGLMSSLIPKFVTYYLSISLFTFFGVSMIREGLSMESKSDESVQEVEKEIKSRRDSSSVQLSTLSMILGRYVSFVFVETFTMNFFAEWGDRSQVSTIVLAARDDNSTLGVVTGALIGHTLCITLAVIGGQMIGKIISIRTVTICGGITFLAFSLHALLFEK